MGQEIWIMEGGRVEDGFLSSKNEEISKTILLTEKKIFAYANVLFRVSVNLWYNMYSWTNPKTWRSQ